MNLIFLSIGIAIMSATAQFAGAEDRMKPDQRGIVGRGISYQAVPVDAEVLQSDMGARRAHAWRVFEQITRTVTIANTGVHTPLFETWYDEEERLPKYR